MGLGGCSGDGVICLIRRLYFGYHLAASLSTLPVLHDLAAL